MREIKSKIMINPIKECNSYLVKFLLSLLLLFQLVSCDEDSIENGGAPENRQLIESKVDAKIDFSKKIEDSLIQNYSALELRHMMHQSDKLFMFQIQDSLENSDIVALRGFVLDIVRAEEGLIILLEILNAHDYMYVGVASRAVIGRITIPSDLAATRLEELKGIRNNQTYAIKGEINGCFLIKDVITHATVSRIMESEISNIETNGFGEVKHASTENYYLDSPSLFISGKLVDFVVFD